MEPSNRTTDQITNQQIIKSQGPVPREYIFQQNKHYRVKIFLNSFSMVKHILDWILAIWLLKNPCTRTEPWQVDPLVLLLGPAREFLRDDPGFLTKGRSRRFVWRELLRTPGGWQLKGTRVTYSPAGRGSELAPWWHGIDGSGRSLGGLGTDTEGNVWCQPLSVPVKVEKKEKRRERSSVRPLLLAFVRCFLERGGASSRSKKETKCYLVVVGGR